MYPWNWAPFWLSGSITWLANCRFTWKLGWNWIYGFATIKSEYRLHLRHNYKANRNVSSTKHVSWAGNTEFHGKTFHLEGHFLDFGTVVFRVFWPIQYGKCQDRERSMKRKASCQKIQKMKEWHKRQIMRARSCKKMFNCLVWREMSHFLIQINKFKFSSWHPLFYHCKWNE